MKSAWQIKNFELRAAAVHVRLQRRFCASQIRRILTAYRVSLGFIHSEIAATKVNATDVVASGPGDP
jgi:hypothetical protein